MQRFVVSHVLGHWPERQLQRCQNNRVDRRASGVSPENRIARQRQIRGERFNRLLEEWAHGRFGQIAALHHDNRWGGPDVTRATRDFIEFVARQLSLRTSTRRPSRNDSEAAVPQWRFGALLGQQAKKHALDEARRLVTHNAVLGRVRRVGRIARRPLSPHLLRFVARSRSGRKKLRLAAERRSEDKG